ncbi:argininosuccinate lyase, partial [Hyphomicrobiales bacterium]|nr:argininosuccinate lyase [Hyphomicrobiales bacterium]
AQPITFGHHLLAYVELAERDKGRFTDCLQRLDECPLGAAALAGTSYPIDRFMTASILGFKKPMANSLDAVSSRDLLLETLSVIAITAINLSRFAEELVLWSSTEFNYIKLSDKYTSGSSIMPQKRNPDAAELVRAKSGRTIGSLITLFTVLKGLPLAYSKDMQEDKEALFDSIDTIEISLLALIGMVGDMKPNIEKMQSASKEGFSIATDIADMLVIKIGIPFREAHNIVGKMVALAEKNNTYLDKLDPKEIITIDKRIPNDIMSLITIDNMVLNKTSYGGTSPHEVLKRANEWVERLS